MRPRQAARLKWLTLEGLLAISGFVYVAAAFADASLALWLVRWRFALAAILTTYLVLARGRLTISLAGPIAGIIGISLLGLLAQIGEDIDSRAVELAAGYVSLALVAFAAAPAALRRRRSRIVVFRGLLWGVLAGVLTSAALGVAHPLVGFHIDGLRIRFKGYYDRPNSAGYYGYVGAVLAVMAALDSRRKWTIALLPVFVAAVWLANSRGAMIGLVLLGIGWVTLLVPRLPRRWKLGLTGFATVAGLWWLASSPGWIDRLSFPTSEVLDQATSGRWYSWEQSLSYLDDPISLGIGLGLSRNISFTPDNAGLRGGESDDFYVDLIGRTGLVGFALFLAVVASMGRRLAAGVRRADLRSAPQRAFCLALLVSALSYGVVESHLLTTGVLHAVVLWSILSWAATRDEPV